MGTIKNIRTTADVTMNTRLKDGGVAIDWASLSDVKAWLYSDAQKAIAGRCDVSIDATDWTKLVCRYSATKPQYLGINRIIVQASYMGEQKTYDKPVFNFVRWTGDQASQELTIDDPDVDVEIEVTDVSSSIMDAAIAAAIAAAVRAEAAAEAAEHMVNIHQGPPGKSAYQVAVDNGYTGTEEEWLASLVGPAGKSAYELAVQEGYEGTLAQWLASLKGPQGDSAYDVAVQEGFVGTKAQWLASLVGPQGLSAYQVAVVEGFDGSVSEWLASLVGPAGPPGITAVEATVDNNVGTPSVVATLLNQLLSLAFHNMKGEPGEPGVGLDAASTPAVVDGTFIITLSNGDTITVDLNHYHPQYYSKEAMTEQPAGGFLPDVAYNLGEISGAVTFDLAAAVTGNLNHYFWSFDTGTTAPTITWPSGITWAAGNAPIVQASKHYEVSILDGIACYLEV